MSHTLNGIDVLVRDGLKPLAGRSFGIVCNQASITRGLIHTLDALLPGHQHGRYRIQAAFGPQHGIWGHTQDNMIEWEGYVDPSTGLRFHSLYGEHREPTDDMLEGMELMVVDLPDVGARYYTFIWTLALCLKACERRGIPVLVLDRPNPLGGERVEGTLMERRMASFVGLYPLPIRHGMTIAEIALHLKATEFPRVELDVVPMEGWSRAMDFEETGLAWALPSPNMPTVDTAYVYPGQCLLEGTRLSEGRGTTRPFEIFGAPYVDGRILCAELNAHGLPGAWFRPVQFEPTFQKHAGRVCQGAFLHVTDRRAFEPVLAGIAVLREVVRLYGESFQWLEPPYEYVWDRMPIDILAGNEWVRKAVESGEQLPAIRERMAAESSGFLPARDQSLLYR